MADQWTKEQWRRALAARGTDAEAEAYHRLAQYLMGNARKYLFGERSENLYLKRQSDADIADLAEDFVRHTIAVFHEKLSTFEWRCLPTTYATTILTRHMLRVLTKRAREILTDFTDPHEDPNNNVDPLGRILRQLPDGENTRPDVLASKRQFLEALRICIEQLPPMQRSSFIGCCVEERPPIDVAGILHTSVEAIYQNVHRARKALQECLARQDYVPNML
jgi:RNA polymerase sigma factor (sigma-70 family)